MSSLVGVLNLRGRSGLNHITKEIAWRRVRCHWRFAAGRLPTERNQLSDALSRLAAPAGAEQKTFPPELRAARERTSPEFDKLWTCS